MAVAAPHHLLVAGASAHLFDWLRAQASSPPTLAGRAVHPEFCPLDRIDERLRDSDADALLITETRFDPRLTASLGRWRVLRPDLQVLFVFEEVPHHRQIVDLMRAGAHDVIEPGDGPVREAVSSLLRRVDEARLGDVERRQARQSLADLGLIGESAEMQNVFVQILHASRLSCPVLITGQSGAGKTLVAHAIHALSARGARAVVAVDCAVLPPALLDAALFGVPSPGRPASAGLPQGPLLEAVRRGTLILQSVADTPVLVQPDLSRLLEYSESEGAGLDIRFLSTSARKLEERVDARAFRADLAWRLSVLTLEVPPLRRRSADIVMLARYFLAGYARDNRAFTLSDEALAVLCRYEWPDNVRELRRVIESAVARCVDGVIQPVHLPEHVRADSLAGESTRESLITRELNLARLEEQAILRALQVSGFDKAKAARVLGIGKTTLYRKLKEISARARRAS